MFFSRIGIVVIVVLSFVGAVTKKDLEQLPIVSVVVSGSSQVSAEVLQGAHVRTQAGFRVNQTVIQNDLKNLMATGRYAAADVGYTAQQDGLHVCFVVTENPKIKAIEFIGLRSFSVDKFSRVFRSASDNVLNYGVLEKDIARANRLYKKYRYDLSSVSSVALQQDRLVVTCVEPVVSNIYITGNVATQESLIRREVHLVPGSIYNSQRLLEDHQRILGLGYFSIVSLPEIIPADQVGQVDLKLRVREKEKDSFNIGLGVTSREQFAFTRLSLKNRLGYGEQVLMSYQTGREYRDASAYPKTSYQFRYFLPWFFVQDISWGYTKYGTTAYERLRDSQSDTVDVLRIRRDGFSCDFAAPLVFGPRYRFITEYKDETVAEVVASPKVRYINKSIAGTYLYNGVKMLPDTAIPAEGESFRFTVERGGYMQLLRLVNIGLGGEAFTKVDTQYVRYMTLGENNHILGLQYRGGVFRPDATRLILEGEEYSVGGGSTVRGYPDVSPFAYGSKQTIVNLEYSYVWSAAIQTVIFYDWGNAYQDILTLPSDFKSAAGLGLRWQTPVGPVRFDLGKGKDWIFHFGLGYMF